MLRQLLFLTSFAYLSNAAPLSDEKRQEKDDFHDKLMKIITAFFTNTKSITTSSPVAGNKDIISEEYGQYYEGDMIIDVSKAKSGILRTNYWKNGVVPFDFDKNFPSEDRHRVMNVISYLNRETCLTFRKHWYFIDGGTYVTITNKKPGCFATVGRPSSGKGRVNLSKPCMEKDGVIIHELLHSVGIFHEHSRHDRDNYVKVHWENIHPGDQHNFVRRNNFQVFDIPYDYYSIMHYSTHAYSRNGLPTLEPKKFVDFRRLGQRDYLTASDLEKLKRIYCY